MSDSPTLAIDIPPPPPDSRPRASKRRGVRAAALAIVLLLVSAAVVAAVARGGRAEAQPLALAFEPGESRSFRIHQTLEAEVSSLAFGSEEISLDLTRTVGWEVLAVNEGGVATIEVTTSSIEGTVDGSEIPVPEHALPPIRIRISPDGRVLAIDRYRLDPAWAGDRLRFPVMDEWTPLLPDEPVAPGDTWEETISHDLPLDAGTIEVSTSGVYERNETVNGIETAVIATTLDAPLDLTIDLADLAASVRAAAGRERGPLGWLERLGASTVAVGGSVHVQTTSWIDLDARDVVRTQGSGSFDVTLSVGLGDLSVPSVELSGTMSQDVERVG
jgi:hypothetical protein